MTQMAVTLQTRPVCVSHPLATLERTEGTHVNHALPLWAEQLAVFDTETTGVDTSTARVVSSTVALIGPAGLVHERYDWLVDPGIDIPVEASRIHGITTAVARASGVRAEVGVQQIIERLGEMSERGFAIVAYNAPFDLSLLATEARRYALPWPDSIGPIIDPLVLDRQFDRYRKGKRTLDVVAAHYGVPLEAAHDAGEDAIAAGQVAQAIARKYAASLPADLSELHRSQVGWAAAQAENFQSYMRRTKDPAFLADGQWPLRVR